MVHFEHEMLDEFDMNFYVGNAVVMVIHAYPVSCHSHRIDLDGCGHH